MDYDEPKREDGIDMYLYLQGVAGVKTTAKKAGAAWDKMTIVERKQVEQTYCQYMNEYD